MRGCAISSVTLARSFFWKTIFVFLSLFLIPIQSFSYQTQSNAVQLNLQDVQTASQLPLLVVFLQYQFRDEPSSDARVTWRTTRTKRYTNCRYSNPSPCVAWLHPLCRVGLRCCQYKAGHPKAMLDAAGFLVCHLMNTNESPSSFTWT